jgi:tRNA-specific 2-thiouridylase
MQNMFSQGKLGKKGWLKITSKKVFVGMSGGVDSSVSAALLVEAGYDVTGVFIKVWQPEKDMFGRESDFKCTWREDRLDAMRVAAQLRIPFITLDLEEEYKRHVVDYMIAEYRAGRTPNPDVMCNKYVKFGGFFDWAMRPEQGAEYVATGHYARVENVAEKYSLLAGDDPNKDQSYFLWTLTQKQLAKTLFPVGNMEKPNVRELARRFGLPNADKKDSQGLCFIGKIDVKEFLAHYIHPKTGDVLEEVIGTSGKKNIRKIGRHDGAFFFTIGERHGFTIDEAHTTPHDSPYYVIAKNVEKNTITVSQKMPSGKMSEETAVQRIRLTEINWTRGAPPLFETGNKNNKNDKNYKNEEKYYSARPRYRAPLVPITLKSFDEKSHTAEIEFAEPQQTISSGQSLVIYDSSICLGGGIIN